MSEYQEIIDRLPKQMLAGEDNRLEILHQVLDALGHPEHQYQIIHVAGTNDHQRLQGGPLQLAGND